MISDINKTILAFARRADHIEPSILRESFVDVGSLSTLLLSKDHQVIYGRRGTGKTHALVYLTETVRRRGDIPIMIDMRTIGSTGGIFADNNIPLTERATRLLIDTIAEIHDSLLDYVLSRSESDEVDLSQLGPTLDRLSKELSQLSVIGDIEREMTFAHGQERRNVQKSSFTAELAKPKLDFASSTSKMQERKSQIRWKETGKIQHRVHFGAIGRIFSDLSDVLSPKHIWLILDEWSHIPMDLQPFLADLLRRSIFPVSGITVKTAAIEQRTRFRIGIDSGDYIGFELGADVAADVDLDDFMVFDCDSHRAKDFFKELFFKHFKSAQKHGGSFAYKCESVEELIKHSFTQQKAFDEFVKSTEGVPRDAINILVMAAQEAVDRQISIQHIRKASKKWYHRDKDSVLRSNEAAQYLLHCIIDEVIGNRRARAFLLRSDTKNDLIDFLFDSRVLHIIKRDISAYDQPGTRYDVYKIDYGCYVDLISTPRATQGLLPISDSAVNPEAKTNQFVDVPPDDYRAIRKAILELSAFQNRYRPYS